MRRFVLLTAVLLSACKPASSDSVAAQRMARAEPILRDAGTGLPMWGRDDAGAKTCRPYPRRCVAWCMHECKAGPGKLEPEADGMLRCECADAGLRGSK